MNDPAPQPATHREIARRAGVSNATVSLALNHNPRITAATRQKVLRIARELAYTPKSEVVQIMGAIRRKRPELETLALVTNWTTPAPWKNNPYSRRFHESVTRRARELGYQIEEFWLRESGMTAKRLSSVLYARNIAGLIIPPAFFNVGKRLPFDISRLAVASHGRVFWRPELNRVEADHHYNTLLALKELVRLGYQRIGLVCMGGRAWLHGHQIESAYAYYQTRCWIATDVPPFLSDGYDFEGFREWFHTHHPDVILSTFPNAIDWLKEVGLSVPQEIGFACIGVIPELGDSAGIDIRSDLIDSALVDMVVSQINLGERGAPSNPRATLFEGVWQSGGTLRQISTKPTKSKPTIRAERGKIAMSSKERGQPKN